MGYTVKSDDERIICPECKGYREVYDHYDGTDDIYRKCSYCNGIGMVRRISTVVDEKITN